MGTRHGAMQIVPDFHPVMAEALNGTVVVFEFSNMTVGANENTIRLEHHTS
jgi:hypothetical protein